MEEEELVKDGHIAQIDLDHNYYYWLVKDGHIAQIDLDHNYYYWLIMMELVVDLLKANHQDDKHLEG